MSLNSIFIWDAEPRSSELLLMTNSCVQFCGRGSDIASATLSDVHIGYKRTKYGKRHYLGQKISRTKTSARNAVSIQEHAVYPHRDRAEFMTCYYWSLAYHLIISKESIIDNDLLFPSFHSKMYSNDGSLDSRVSEHYNKMIDIYFNIMFDLYAEKRELEKYSCMKMLFWYKY